MYLPKKLLTLLLKQLPRLLEWQFFCKSKTFAKFLTVKNELHWIRRHHPKYRALYCMFDLNLTELWNFDYLDTVMRIKISLRSIKFLHCWKVPSRFCWRQRWWMAICLERGWVMCFDIYLGFSLCCSRRCCVGLCPMSFRDRDVSSLSHQQAAQVGKDKWGTAVSIDNEWRRSSQEKFPDQKLEFL